MTVREMIRQLIMYPMDLQVVDTTGSPIMFMGVHGREGENVQLKPKSQIDVNVWLDDYFREVDGSCVSDANIVWDLKYQGFTLEDIKNYNEDIYKFVLKTMDEYEIEWDYPDIGQGN